MGLSREQSISQYGTEAYTAWGSVEAEADFKATGGSKSGGGGGGDLSVPSISDFTAEAFGPADKALDAYVMSLRGRRQPLDVFSELEEAAGLPGMKKTATTLREQIGGLEDTIRRVERNVTATTRESFTTEGQRQGMIEARQRPLFESLGTLATGLGRISEGITAASADLSTRMGLYLQGQAQALEPFEVMLTAANEKAARLVSGYTIDIQNELQINIAKWNRNNELDDAATARSFELLLLEKGYGNELTKMVEQSKIDLDEYSQQSKIDIGEYTSKKEIDKRFKVPKVTSTATGTNQYYTGASNFYDTSGGGIDSLWGLKNLGIG